MVDLIRKNAEGNGFGDNIKNTTNSLSIVTSSTQAAGVFAKITLSSVDLAITLPFAGTYLVYARCHFDATSVAGELKVKLRNFTDSTDVAGSFVNHHLDNTWGPVPIITSIPVTTTGDNKVIQMWFKNDGGLAAANAMSNSESHSLIYYVRLY